MNSKNHRMSNIYLIITVVLMLFSSLGTDAWGGELRENQGVATFSIVACDPEAGELGIAVASRFFAVGSVVPWAQAEVGAVATQSFANTSFGWRGLDLLSQGVTPEQVVTILLQNDDDPGRRQFGVVAADGKSASYTGSECLAWAGGCSGPNYAVQGNILTGEAVVAAMEEAFLKTEGTLAERIYAALVAGDAEGGDSRGKQSTALLIVKQNAGYGGYNDRAIDIRVDDHPEPFTELGRLLHYALVNYAWNEGWTLFMQQAYIQALLPMERAARLAPDNPELLYDLAVIQLAAGHKESALETLKNSLQRNPRLKQQASADNDLKALWDDSRFKSLVK